MSRSDHKMARLSVRLQTAGWVIAAVSLAIAVLRWLIFPGTRLLPPTLAAQMPDTGLTLARRIVGFGVELIPLSAALYSLRSLHLICVGAAKRQPFGAATADRYRAFGLGLMLLGLGNGVYTALITVVLTYTPTGKLRVPLGLSTSDLYLMMVGAAVILTGHVMEEAYRIYEDNSRIV